MCKFLRFLLPIICVAVATANLHAGLVIFDLRDVTGTAGAALDEQPDGTQFTQGGITISAVTTTSLTGNTGSTYNATGSSGGVDSLGLSGTGSNDANNGIDAEETLKFTFTFSSAVLVELESILLVNQTGDLEDGDQAIVNVAGNTTTLYEGVIGVGTYSPDTPDVWTPSDGIFLDSGDMITFGAGNSYGLSNIQFNVTNVPEPSSLLMFGTALVSILVPRKRRR